MGGDLCDAAGDRLGRIDDLVVRLGVVPLTSAYATTEALGLENAFENNPTRTASPSRAGRNVFTNEPAP